MGLHVGDEEVPQQSSEQKSKRNHFMEIREPRDYLYKIIFKVFTGQIVSFSGKLYSWSHPRMLSGLLTETKNHDSVLLYKCIPLACFSSDKMGTIMCAGCSSIEDPSLEIVLTLDKEDEAISKIVFIVYHFKVK